MISVLPEVFLEFQKPSEDSKVTLATRMYLDEGFKINKTFRKISKKTLDIRVPQVNFANGMNASETINSWVSNETNGKISELFSPGQQRRTLIATL